MVMEFAGGGLPSDERFHVRGGNDQLVSGLVDRLPDGTVVRDAPLNRLVRSRAGSYRLGFASGPDAAADVVVLCAPFSALRHSDLDGSGLSKRKLSCIRSLGMGTNAKVLLQLDRRVTDYGATPARHWTGGYYDARVDTWDSSAAEGGRGPACSRSTPAATSERRTLPARHMVRHRGTSSRHAGRDRPSGPRSPARVRRTRLARLVGRRPLHAWLLRRLRARPVHPLLGLRRLARAPRPLRRRAHLAPRPRLPRRRGRERPPGGSRGSRRALTHPLYRDVVTAARRPRVLDDGDAPVAVGAQHPRTGGRQAETVSGAGWP